ncbi:MAG TPA: hypothetical protein PLT00_15035 [Verrucomicrobiota bacterium]|nr:hypothetical protein [Verrucomicrobiota bacterium]HQB18013.1 hypothetical protein [Verrucomicrobiota bacterium]
MSRSLPVVPEPPLRRWGGLLVRRSGWKLSLGGWLLLLALMVGFAGGFLRGIHPFLAVTHPLRGPILVVEGWSPNFAMPQVAAEYAAGSYQQVLVVRGIYETGGVYDSGRYSGEYLTNLLAQQGIPRERLAALFPTVVRRDRTYHSALAVKAWLAQQGRAVDSLDVATVGAHARRSRLLYQKAMGKGLRVGIIALEDKQYDPRHWWQSSEGVREVLGESIAYIYARCFFRTPNESGSRAKAEPFRPLPVLPAQSRGPPLLA